MSPFLDFSAIHQPYKAAKPISPIVQGAGEGIGREALMQTASEVMNSDADASNEETAAEDAANEGTENEERNDS